MSGDDPTTCSECRIIVTDDNACIWVTTYDREIRLARVPVSPAVALTLAEKLLTLGLQRLSRERDFWKAM